MPEDENRSQKNRQPGERDGRDRNFNNNQRNRGRYRGKNRSNGSSRDGKPKQQEERKPQAPVQQSEEKKDRPAVPAQNAQNAQNVQKKQNQKPQQKQRDRRPRPEEPEKKETLPAEEESFLPPVKDDGIFAGFQKEDDAVLDTMPPDPTLDAVFSDPAPAASAPEEGIEVVGVHFPQGGKVYYFDPAGRKLETGASVIVETARGIEVGEVAIANRKVPESEVVMPLKPVMRRATAEDLAHHADNKRREEAAAKICAQKAADHKLDMKLVGTQYTFDNSKLIVYFTAAQRVDFRELVKDLASTFHTRIEMRQIGIRDEAKMLGGCGICGRKICCSVFLPNYAQVSIKMAKDQGLSINSSKISGNCGRLMCCLRYEHGAYEEELSRLPTVDSVVDTPDGQGRVTEVRPIKGVVKVKLDSQPDAVPKVYSAETVKIIRRAAEKRDDAQPSDVPPED